MVCLIDTHVRFLLTLGVSNRPPTFFSIDFPSTTCANGEMATKKNVIKLFIYVPATLLYGIAQ
jgi:hypothetical protein